MIKFDALNETKILWRFCILIENCFCGFFKLWCWKYCSNSKTEGCHTEVPTTRWNVDCRLKLFCFLPYKEYIRKCTYSYFHVSCSVLRYSPCGGCRILILNKTTDHENVVHVLWQFFSDFSKFCLKFDVQFQGTRRKKRSRRPFGPSIISA